MNSTLFPLTLDALRDACRAHPDDAAAAHALGRALVAREAFDEARHELERAVDLAPDDREVRASAARVLSQLGRPDEAAFHVECALRLDPSAADFWLWLGKLYEQGLGGPVRARDAFLQAIARAPDAPDGYVKLSLQALRQYSPGEARTQVARMLDGRDDAVVTRGFALALHTGGWHEEALPALTSVLHGAPDDRIALISRAISKRALHDLPAAADDLEAARRAHPTDRTANLEWIYHLCGVDRWEDAKAVFRGLARQLQRADPTFWTGEDAPNRTIVFEAREGYGDTIQFTRFAGLAAAAGLHVVLDCRPRLIRLLRGVPGVHEIVAPHDPRGSIDYRVHPAHVGLLRAPVDFWTHVAPHLHVPANLLRDWTRRTGDTGGLRVGLAWSGVPGRDRYRHRFMRLPDLQPLATIPGVRLFSVQVQGPDQAEDRAAAALVPMVDLAAGFTDFADTAAAVAALDLIISVDTSVAHVAGGLGRPCWVILPYAADWRWGFEGSRSSWYPSVRLFRQSRPGDWAGVVREVAEQLRALAAADTRDRCAGSAS